MRIRQAGIFSRGGHAMPTDLAKTSDDGWAADLQAIIERGDETQRFEHLKNALAVVMHRVHELEKGSTSTARRINELAEQLRHQQSNRTAR
jgi:hypothetical protein